MPNSIALIAQPTSAWYDFLLPQVISGVGIGCIFPPMTTVAMRNVSPAMAGAASGVFNTTRQLGTVIGAAGVGALLQNRLIAGFTSQARLRTSGLPPQARDKLLAGFQAAAKGGLQVGSGHRTTGVAGEIFTHGFVSALRPTMIVPIVFIAAAAVSCVFIKRRAASDRTSTATEVGEATATAAG